MVICPAALDLPHGPVERVTKLIVTREGDRRCTLRPSQHAMAALAYLREHTTLAKTAAGSRTSESTAHPYTSTVTGLLSERAPGLLKVQRGRSRVRPAGRYARRVRQSRRQPGRPPGQTPPPPGEPADGHRPGQPAAWLSPALPGPAHDLTAGHTHTIIRIRERPGVPILADLAHQRAGPWLTTGIKHRPLQELTPTEKTLNQTPAAARTPVEHGVARLKSRQIFHKSRYSPNRTTPTAKALPTPERQHRRSVGAWGTIQINCSVP